MTSENLVAGITLILIPMVAAYLIMFVNIRKKSKQLMGSEQSLRLRTYSYFSQQRGSMSSIFIAFNILFIGYTLFLNVPRLKIIVLSEDKVLQFIGITAIMSLGISYYLLYKIVLGFIKQQLMYVLGQIPIQTALDALRSIYLILT